MGKPPVGWLASGFFLFRKKHRWGDFILRGWCLGKGDADASWVGVLEVDGLTCGSKKVIVWEDWQGTYTASDIKILDYDYN